MPKKTDRGFCYNYICSVNDKLPFYRILKMIGSSRAHSNLLSAFDKAVTKERPRVLIIPYTVGIFRDYETAERIVKVGMPGVPDRILLLSNGSYLLLDAKTGGATFSKSQRNFDGAVFHSCGHGRMFALRSVEQGLELIDRFEGK